MVVAHKRLNAAESIPLAHSDQNCFLLVDGRSRELRCETKIDARFVPTVKPFPTAQSSLSLLSQMSPPPTARTARPNPNRKGIHEWTPQLKSPHTIRCSNNCRGSATWLSSRFTGSPI